MSRESLVFERLFVRRMPGVPDGFMLDGLSSGLNVVHGPNASGKTTTARAIESLLWPRAAAPSRASLEARLTLGREAWRVEVDGARARLQCEGREAMSLPVPPAEARDRYRLSLHELLASDNRPFAEAIVRESAGGYDVAGAAGTLHCRPGPSRSPSEAKVYDAAKARLREARAKQDELRGEEARLATLRQRIDSAGAAAKRVRLLERAVEAAEAAEEVRTAREALAAFPKALSRLGGDEADRLAALRKRRNEAEAKLADAERERQAALARVQEAALPEGGAPPHQVAALRGRVETLRELSRSIDTLEQEHRAALAARAEELGRLAGSVDEARLARISLPELRELAAFARQAAELQAREAAAEADARWLGEAGAVAEDRERLDEGVKLLRRWLRAGNGEAAGEKRLRALGVTAAALFLATSLAAAIALFPAHGAIVAPVGLVLLVAGVALLFLLLRPARDADPRAVHRREYEGLGLERPSRWDDDAVITHLAGLERRLAEATLAAERARRREEAMRRQAELASERVVLDEKRAALAAQLGADPATDPTALPWLAERIGRWQDADRRVREAEAMLASARDRFATEFAAAREGVARFGYAEVSDVASIAAAVEAIAERVETHRRALDAADAAARRIDEATAEIAGLEEERRALLSRLGLVDGGEARVAEWCARLGDYHNARDVVVAAERRVRDAMARLTATEGYEPGLETRGQDALRDALDAARREAGELEALRDEASRIEALIDKAKEGHDVEAALAEVARAEEALRTARARDELGVVGHALVEFVQRQTRDQHLPEVFHRARESFALITRGRFRLEFDDGAAPAFRAYDTVTGEGLGLDELSSGTRVQLLLSVRLAFVERQETGARLPLLLDETLGNSDDARAEAIMDAVLALAEEGRQIFYFTAQPDEVGKWKGIVSRRDSGRAAFIDLAAARRLEGETTMLPVVDPPVARVPAPAGRTHAEYGRLLGVPPIEPQLDVEAVHLWHVVDDPKLLHRLLSLGVERWGALRELVEHGGRALLGDDASSYDRILATVRALEAALDAARIGRGRPVDRAVLEESGAVSDRFLDRVAELCQACGRDAELLLDGLEAGRVERFRRNAIQQLRDYLEVNGYLDGREALDGAAIRARVLGAVAAEVRAGIIDAGVVERVVGAVADGPVHP